MNIKRVHSSATIDHDKPYIVYLITESMRLDTNYSLYYAMMLAKNFNKPLYIAYCKHYFKNYQARHHHFINQGLSEFQDLLKTYHADIHEINDLAFLQDKACTVVTDFLYLQSRRAMLAKIKHVSLVEGNIIVPVSVTSDHSEYQARTIRPKIYQHLETYLHDFDYVNYQKLLKETQYVIDDTQLFKFKEQSETTLYAGGQLQAEKQFDYFMKKKANDYAKFKSFPEKENTSLMSMYLAFGQVSLHTLYEKMNYSNIIKESKDAYLEEIVIRRELALNFAYFEDVEQFETIKWANWQVKAFEKGQQDAILYYYDEKVLETYQTHDVYFNAAMQQLIKTGHMHGYMRMYWGKKIIEWTKTFKEAFDIMVNLNNRYAIDGLTPNSYEGIAWCFGKHDRPWFMREKFATIRYMNANGLKRKFNIDEYVCNQKEIAYYK